MDSLIHGKLFQVFTADTYMPPNVSICLKNGIYSFNISSNPYIKSYYKDYTDTSFFSSYTRE